MNALSRVWSDLATVQLEVKPTTLPTSLLKFPPSPEPSTIPPPTGHPSLAHPFTIPADIYNGLLSATVPITIALVYASVVAYLNSVNARRKYKPWAFSKTATFKLLVILHNIILAGYSAWTFVGMINALRLSFADWHEAGVAGSVDSLCKLHGPRGFGSAATYNVTNSAWGFTNRVFHLAADGLVPESSDVGRIWNEGLAFYGWLFYLSKFYEVIDTAIILAKGKKSSFLQTYHHAGAMLCMWAGIRYMSPPIWMFVLVNSGIHAIMYTFYLCSAIGVKVPKWFKQSLTTLQITQFVVGATYAFLHLFVAYRVPVSVPYLYHLGNVVSSVASALPSDASSAKSVALSTASAGIGSWLKKAAFRAAGREGLAENVLNEQGQTFGVDAVHAVQDFVSREETRYRDELQWVHCLDTSGQVFAILLNCMYLAPLTYLFARFFITAYLKRVERRRSSTASEKIQIARQSWADASKGVGRRVSEVVEEMRATVEEMGDDEVVIDGGEIQKELKDAKDIAQQKIQAAIERSKDTYSKIDAEKLKQEVEDDLEKVRQSIKEKAKTVQKQASGISTTDVKEKVSNAARETKAKVADVAADAQAKSANLFSEDTKAAAREAASAAEANVKETAKKAGKKVSDIRDSASSTAKILEEKAATTTSEQNQPSPNGDGTGAAEATGTLSNETAEEVKEKKKEDKIIDESQAVRDEDVDAQEGKAD